MLNLLDAKDGKYSIYSNILSEIDDNILDSNLSELTGETITLTDSNDIMRCRYNPKYLSYKYFKTIDLWYLIMRMNKLSNVTDMDTTKKKDWIIPTQSDLNKLSLIISSYKSAFN